VEVSADGEEWEIVADYSKGGTVPHLTTGGNQTTIKIDPDDYACEDTCYVRLRNTNPSMGWGGSITNLTFTYQRKVQ
jgi:hypothetical protein